MRRLPAPGAVWSRFPRDAEGTLDRVAGGALRLGASPSPPWVQSDGGASLGVEDALARSFAETIAAELDRRRLGGAASLLSALEHRQLDLVIAGLDASSPWKSRVHLTRPYFEEIFTVADAEGAPVASIDGERVLTPPASALSARVEQHGGVAVRDGEANAAGPAALRVVPHWRLAGGSETPPLVLERVRHVLAAPNGENAFIMTLETFLARQSGAVADMLRERA